MTLRKGLQVGVLAAGMGGVAIALATILLAQERTNALDIAAGREMLRQVRETLERHYFDTTYGGRSLDELFAVGERRLANAKSTSDVASAVALPLLDLEDSHTLFLPPPRASRLDYGVDIAVVGDRVLVMAVAPGSDAASQGVSPGDEVLSVNSLEPSRANLWKIQYVLTQLRPQGSLILKLRGSAGGERTVTARARVTQRPQIVGLEFALHDLQLEFDAAKALVKNREHAIGSDILIWKMAAFTDDTGELDRMIRRARGFKTLILDLRGNGGGAVIGLQRLASHFFETAITIARTVERKGMGELMTRPPREPFLGRVIVITDSQSASASEMFARVVQLQKRGIVLGDRTAGAVMESVVVPFASGMARVTLYAMTVTVADVLMADGRRLERVGVTPDETLLPTSEDLRSNRDPVLARAVTLAGGSLSSEEAAKLFPLAWATTTR
jgi:C-terminal processing protease CtpA/Prc